MQKGKLLCHRLDGRIVFKVIKRTVKIP